MGWMNWLYGDISCSLVIRLRSPKHDINYRLKRKAVPMTGLSSLNVLIWQPSTYPIIIIKVACGGNNACKILWCGITETLRKTNSQIYRAEKVSMYTNFPLNSSAVLTICIRIIDFFFTIEYAIALINIHCLIHPLQWRHNGCHGVSNHQPHHCLLIRLFRRRSKKTPKLRVTGLRAGNSPVTGEFPAQKASNAENVSIWWRHHAWVVPRVWNRSLCNSFNGIHCHGDAQPPALSHPHRGCSWKDATLSAINQWLIPTCKRCNLKWIHMQKENTKLIIWPEIIMRLYIYNIHPVPNRRAIHPQCLVTRSNGPFSRG